MELLSNLANARRALRSKPGDTGTSDGEWSCYRIWRMPERRASSPPAAALWPHVYGPHERDMTSCPTRTCVGCRTRRLDNELVRVAVVDGEPLINQRGSGRGAWVCPTASCIEAAGRSRAFSRAFRSKLSDGYFADTLLGWLGNPAV